MATQKILTDFFRAGYVHLDKMHKISEKQDPAFMLTMMFPKTGVTPSHIVGAGLPATINPITDALETVCQEHFNCSFAEAPAAYGIQFPPNWKDGDLDFKKDESGRIMQGQVRETSAGMWMMSVKSELPVGTCNAEEPPRNIDPSVIYSGCWCKAELEVMAYTNKSKQNIIAIKLKSVQMVYNDTNLGGGTNQVSDAASVFAAHGVANSDVKVPTTIAAAPSAPSAPSAPAAPQVSPVAAPVPAPVGVPAPPAPAAPTPPAPPSAPILVQIEGAPYTIDACKQAGWTDQQMIDGGVAKMSNVGANYMSPPNNPPMP